MPTNGGSQPQANRRATAACRFCRYSKLKCSGKQPCDRCTKRSKECIFDDREPGSNSHHRSATSRKRARTDIDTPRSPIRDLDCVISVGPQEETNLLLNRDTTTSPRDELDVSPQFLRNRPNKRRRWLYLGASSTWTFNVRVASIIRDHLKTDLDEATHDFTLDGDAYSISLKKASSDEQPDLSRLPSLDYAIYLVNTVKFHLGDILRLFDEAEFLKNLHELYNEGPGKVGTDRLWYTQCLLLLALGKGFLNARKSPDNTSSADFFSRAMSILPDVFALHEEPVLATEVLATIALYFHCVDMRQSAYSYIGQALRIALVEGMHVVQPTSEFGHRFADRCGKLWWTVYILDRTLSSAVGAPVSIHDDHIRQPLGSPRNSSQRDATLIMHVKLCRVVSYILTELYTADGNLEHSYLARTRAVLRKMAEIAKELEDTIDFKFKTSLETLSKGAVYLRLLYNQCIMLATRPLLLCLLQETLRTMSAGARTKLTIPSSIRDLLQTCVDSASKTLKLLWALNDHNLLDTFLPFNLEFACSAASILIVVDEVLKGSSISSSVKALIHKVLDEIDAGGNRAAPLRQKDLQQLSRLASSFWARYRMSGNNEQTQNQVVEQIVMAQDTTSTTPTMVPIGRSRHCENDGLNPENQGTVAGASGMPTPWVDFPETTSLTSSSLADFAHTFDFPQQQMLFLADHLDIDGISTTLDFGSHGLNEWF